LSTGGLSLYLYADARVQNLKAKAVKEMAGCRPEGLGMEAAGNAVL